MMLPHNDNDDDDDEQEKKHIYVDTMKSFELPSKRRYQRHCAEKVFRSDKWRDETFCLRKKKKTDHKPFILLST